MLAALRDVPAVEAAREAERRRAIRLDRGPAQDAVGSNRQVPDRNLAAAPAQAVLRPAEQPLRRRRNDVRGRPGLGSARLPDR